MTRALLINFAAVVALCAALGLVLSTVPTRAAECHGTHVRASWYGLESCANPRDCRTADNRKFNPNAMTAAHRTLPFGTKLRVTYRGKSVVVRINDRGPFIKGRTLDLSRAAAVRIGLIAKGVAPVCMEVL